MGKILLESAILATLSVPKLEEELKLGYPKDILVELMDIEIAKTEPRKTAIDILDTYLDNIEAEEKAKLEADSLDKTYVLSEGMSITTLAGIKTAGQVIEPKHFKHISTFEDFKNRNIIIEKAEVK